MKKIIILSAILVMNMNSLFSGLDLSKLPEIRESEGKFGIFDQEDKLISPDLYDQIDPLKWGIFAVRCGEKWGILSEWGKKILLPCEFYKVHQEKRYIYVANYQDAYVIFEGELHKFSPDSEHYYKGIMWFRHELRNLMIDPDGYLLEPQNLNWDNNINRIEIQELSARVTQIIYHVENLRSYHKYIGLTYLIWEFDPGKYRVIRDYQMFDDYIYIHGPDPNINFQGEQVIPK